MIQHVAGFTWKPGTTEEDVAALMAMLEALPGRVPAVREYRFGRDLELNPGTSDFAVLALVDDAAGLAAYLEHPFHLEVRELIAPMAESRTAVQFALPG
jgi:Stress responsive A/B Barrel Domain